MMTHPSLCRSVALVAALAIGGLAFAACGDDDDANQNNQNNANQNNQNNQNTGTPPSLNFTVPAVGTAPSFSDLPFPCDLFLDATGHIAMDGLPAGPEASLAASTALRAGLATASGFGQTTAIFFPVTGAVDATSLAGRAHLVDLDDASGVELPITVEYNAEFGVIALHPELGWVLREGHRYGAYLTTGITGPGGPIQVPALLATVLAATSTPADASAARAYAVLAPLLAWVDGEAIARADLVAGTVFTVQRVAEPLAAGRRYLRSLTPPTVTLDASYTAAAGTLDEALGDASANASAGIDPGYERPSSIRHDHIQYLVHGSYASPWFLSSRDKIKGFIEYQDDASPVPKTNTTIRFTVTLPEVDGATPVPLVIYQHGITRGRDDLLGLADVLAAEGVAVIGIDLPWHGSRRSGPSGAPDLVNNITQVAVPDHFGDIAGIVGVGDLFSMSGESTEGITPLDVRSTRDNLRQAQLDLLMFIHLIKNGDFAPLRAVPGLSGLTFDTDRLLLISKSFGVFISLPVVAVEPDVRSAFFSVGPGGFVETTLANSPVYGTQFLPLFLDLFDADPDRVGYGVYPATHHPTMAVFQTLIDQIDPLAFTKSLNEDLADSPRAGEPLHVVMQVCYSDEQVPNQASEALAYALGLPILQHTGNVQAARFTDLTTAAGPLSLNLARAGHGMTGAMVYYTGSTHNLLTDHYEISVYEPGFPPLQERATALDVENSVAHTQQLLVDFVVSAVLDGTPVIGDPYL